MIDLATYKPPEYHYPETPPWLIGALRREFSMFVPPKVKPPVRQVGLFPTLEDQVEEALPKIMAARRSVKKRVKMIAGKFGVTEKEAERAYKVALQRISDRFAYEHYERNKEWYAWVGSEEHKEYARLYMEDVERRNREADEDFRRRIAEGKEHVIRTDHISPSRNMKAAELKVCAERLGVLLSDEDLETWESQPWHDPRPWPNDPDEREARLEQQRAAWEKSQAEKEAILQRLYPIADRLLSMLDRPKFWDGIGQFPLSWAVQKMRITEKDLRIVYARKFARVALGDESTLFTAHTFYAPKPGDEPPRKEYEPPKCSKCGKELTYNEVGLCSKLGWKDICQQCAGVSDEWVKDAIRYYKSTGCSLFI